MMFKINYFILIYTFVIELRFNANIKIENLCSMRNLCISLPENLVAVQDGGPKRKHTYRKTISRNTTESSAGRRSLTSKCSMYVHIPPVKD